MSYHIYTTSSLILKRKNFGEADLMLYVLTKDFGLILASAKSARLLASKNKGFLQEYSFVSISCVKGKNGWKITNVVGEGDTFSDYRKGGQEILAKVSSVLIKMITGESPHREVFLTVKSGFEFLKNLEEKYVLNFEVLIVLRILFELGYVARDDNSEKFLNDMTHWDIDLLKKVEIEKRNLIDLINKALKESHL